MNNTIRVVYSVHIGVQPLAHDSCLSIRKVSRNAQVMSVWVKGYTLYVLFISFYYTLRTHFYICVKRNGSLLLLEPLITLYPK